ncbi:hypothetical protein F4809DRAFT_104183 [Biscogniauxia mediterranea]|nr:hypothetical protein F4809DRAFT_104183 [Biscogniauxia mediterranea]
MTDGTAGTTSNHPPNSPSSPSLSSPTASHSGRRQKRSSSSTSNRDETTPTATTTPPSFYPLQGLPRRPRSQPAMATSVYKQNHEIGGGGKPAPPLPSSPLPLGNIDHDHLYPLPPPPPPKPRLHDDSAADPPPSRLSLRKRAASIDVEEANHHRLHSYGLYTPNTARADDGGPGGGPGDMICLCAKAPKVPRPRNAFILYRQHWQGYIASQNPGLANPDISKLIGEKWRAQPEKVKNEWKKLAEEEKIRHQRQYPDYRYQPRRGGKNASGRPTSASGELPGRCPKCGGRYIATPRTPSTPFSVATPVPPNPSSNMQPYINPNPRVIETEHLRRGSASSGMSVDGHGRRYTQPHMRDFEEDYDAMSPMTAAPEMKRRRYNGPQVFIPGSPPMGYMPVDPRYPQRPSVSGPPLSATGYGPGPLPRPPMPSYRQPSHPNHPHHPNHPQQMQPPPRPSISYQPVKTPTRPAPGFDESLRLPPLQTQVPNSPSIHPEAGHARPMSAVQPNHPTGLGIVNNGTMPIRQQQQHQQQAPPPPPPQPQQVVPTRWPFLLKLEVLRSISPPLKPPGPGGPVFETRGPIIAVEGAAAPLLKEVAAVVEKALGVSGEYAVKLWSDENNTLNPGSSSSGGGDDAGRRSHHQHSNSVGSSGSGSGMSSKSADGKPENNNNNNNNNSTVAGPQPPTKKPPSLLSPIAHYMARMLRWHKVSEDLIRYVTTYAPAPPPPQSSSAGENNNNNNTSDSDSGTKPSPAKLLPVAVLADGYSLSYSDRYAGALHVSDAYRADDHWQWVATLWRGIVGPDLTVYVKRDGAPSSPALAAGAENASGNSCVEFANPAVLVLRVGAAGLDEKVERRLGFEIMEWVRGASFQAGFGGSR